MYGEANVVIFRFYRLAFDVQWDPIYLVLPDSLGGKNAKSISVLINQSLQVTTLKRIIP